MIDGSLPKRHRADLVVRTRPRARRQPLPRVILPKCAKVPSGGRRACAWVAASLTAPRNRFLVDRDGIFERFNRLIALLGRRKPLIDMKSPTPTNAWSWTVFRAACGRRFLIHPSPLGAGSGRRWDALGLSFRQVRAAIGHGLKEEPCRLSALIAPTDRRHLRLYRLIGGHAT